MEINKTSWKRVIALPSFLSYTVSMTELTTLIFCDRQYYFMMAMSKLHIARLQKHQECYDPITKVQVCKRLVINVPTFIEPLYTKILEGLNDEQGRRRLQTLINIGAISEAN